MDDMLEGIRSKGRTKKINIRKIRKNCGWNMCRKLIPERMLLGQLNQRETTHILMFLVSKVRRKRLLDSFGTGGKIIWILEF